MNRDTVYSRLGVRTIINAAGTFTEFGGSRMCPEVIAAWTEAAGSFVDLSQLQSQAGAYIARRLGVEAALVTGGAASGILLGTAAAITMRDPEFVRRDVRAPDGRPYEVLRQRSHRDLYDRQVETCGVRIVDVDTEQDVRQRVSDRTVLMVAYNLHEGEGSIDHFSWLRLATQLGLPSLLDAAADVPPVENLWRLHRMGYDLVAFSGGKAIGGPQGTGLLVGRNALIEAAQRNAVPNEGTVGRVAKVTKEDVVAFCTALEIFLDRGDQIAVRCQQQIETIERMLQVVPSIHCQTMVPPVANHFPHLLLTWDEEAIGLTREQLMRLLREGDPSIVFGRVPGTGSQGLLISPINLQAEEERIVGDRIRATFQSAASRHS